MLSKTKKRIIILLSLSLILGGLFIITNSPNSLLNSELSISELLSNSIGLNLISHSSYISNTAKNLDIQRTEIKNGFQLNYEDIECLITLSEPSTITYSKIPYGIEWTNKLDIPVTLDVTPQPDFEKEIYYNITCNKHYERVGNKLVIYEKNKYNFEIDLSTLEKEYSEPVLDSKTDEIISYDVKPQSYDIIWSNNNTRADIQLKESYKTELDNLKKFTTSDKLVLDPTYTISNITLDADFDSVTCEGGGYMCHLTTNLTSGLVLYMPFDVENNSNAVYDWSGENNDGTLTGATYNTSGGLNDTGAYEFDGTNDYITIGEGSDFSDVCVNGCTFGAWIKNEELNDAQVIIGRWDTNSVRYLQFWLTGANRIAFGLSQDGASDNTLCLASPGYSDRTQTTGEWIFATGVYNTTDCIIYINGVDVDVDSATGSINETAWEGDEDTFIGTQDDGGQVDFFNGTIDEVMIFNRSLSATEISELYAQTFLKFESQTGNHTIKPVTVTSGNDNVNITLQHSNQPLTNLSLRLGYINKSLDDMSGLVLYMPFEWDSGTDVWDISGSDNDGNVIGATFNSSGGLNGTGGYEFDGVDGNKEITLPSDPSLNMTNHTISVWFRMNSLKNYNMVLVDAEGNYIAIASDGDVLHYWMNSSGTDVLDDVKNNNLLANTWYHYVITYSVDADNYLNITYYINGEYNDYNYDPGGISAVPKTAIGGRSGSYIFNGSIDEVMIFNRSLSASEVSNIYGNQSQMYNVISYTDPQNVTDNANATFTISTNTSFIFPDFDFIGDSNRFWSPVLENTIILDTFTEGAGAPADAEHPLFSSYVDNNLTNGDAEFNVTLTSTNGTVILQINGSNYTASNDSSVGSNFNVTVTGLTNGVYVYNWSGYGNGTDALWNISVNQYFTMDTLNPNINFTDPTPASGTQSSNSIFINLTTNDTHGTSTFVDFNRSLVLWYNFDNRNSSTIFDNSSYGNDGNITGAVPTTSGARGDAFEFDGTGGDDKITIAPSDSLNLTNYTHSFWMKIHAQQTYNILIVDSGNEYLRLSSNDLRKNYLNSTEDIKEIACNNYINDLDTWYHVVLTSELMNQSNISFKWYVNGEFKEEDVGVDGLTPNPIVAIGAYSVQEFNGSIDEVMIFNRVLSAAEIQALYNSTSKIGYANNFTDLIDGNYTFTGYVIDEAGNVNETEERTMLINTSYIDKEHPIFSSYVDNNLTNGNAMFNVTITSTNGTVVLQINGSNYTASNDSSVGSNFNVTVPGLTNGIYVYNWSGYGNGSSSLWNISVNQYFTMDTINPNINFSSPTPASGNQSSDSIFINITSSDANDISTFVDFNKSLVLWMNFDNRNSSDDATDLSTYSNNGTVTGATMTTSGARGDAFEFDGVNDYIATGITNGSDLCTNGCTFAAWVKPKHNDTAEQIVGRYDITDDHRLLEFQLVNGRFQLNLGSTVDGSVCSATTAFGYFISINEWVFVSAYYNTSQCTICINGNQYCDDDTTVTAINNSLWAETEVLYVGAKDDSNIPQEPFNGTIDEVMVFSRALSAAEIQALYNSTNKIGYANNFTGLSDYNYTFTGYVIDEAGNVNETEERTMLINTSSSDDEHPVFSNYVEEIANNTEYFYNREYKFNTTVTSTNGTVVFQIGGNNYTATNEFGDNYNVTIVGLSVGDYIYNWSGYGNGTDTLFNYSVIQDYTIALNTTLQGSLSGDGTFEYPHSTTITGTESNDGDGGVSYDLVRANVSVGTPETATLGVGNWFYVYNASAGTNYSSVAVLDSATVSITQNTTLVLGITGTTPITYGVTSDIAGSGCPIELSCSLDNANAIYSAGTHFFNYSTAGNSNYSAASANFSLIVNQNSSLVGLTINGTSANILIYQGSQIWLNGTLKTGEGNSTLYLNGTAINSSNYGTEGAKYFYNFSVIGYHNVTFLHPATQNYTFNVSTYYVNVTAQITDTTNPSVTINYPTANYQNFSTANVNINSTITDDNLQNCWYSNDTGITNHTFTCGTNLTTINWDEGNNEVFIFANDSYGNLNNSESINFTVDTIFPQVTYIPPTPDNNSVISLGLTDTFWHNVSLVNGENMINVSFITTNLTGNCVTCGIDVYAYNETNHERALTTDGNYSIYVTACDFAGNCNSTQTRFFTNDHTAPTFDTGTPYNMSGYTNDTYVQNINATDNLLNIDCFTINDTTHYSINCSGYFMNITPISSGGYILNVTVNDTIGNTNFILFNVTVSELPVDSTPPTFTGIPDNETITYGENWTGVDFNATDETLFGTFYIDDTTNFTINSSGYLDDIRILQAGSYRINISINDSTGNQNSTYYNLTVNQANPNASLTSSNTWTIDYGTGTNITYSEINSGDGDVNYTILKDGVYVPIGEEINLSAGVYSYILNATEGTNYSSNASIDTETLTINQISSEVNLYLNNSRSNITISEGDAIDLNGTIVTGSAQNITLYINGTILNSSLSEIHNNYNFTAVGLHNITIIYFNNTNYTSSYETWWVNVSVVVIDTTPPTFNNLRNFTQIVNISFSQSITATDDTSSVNYFLNQTNEFNINITTGLITNVTQLNTIAIHYLNLTANDTSGNMVSGIFFINITESETSIPLKTSCYLSVTYDNPKIPVLRRWNC